eukprot:TRINITY_DN3488_c0_g5_i1.p1 TRINITY_DN3488_c0_g5~~TRINITY_DN3488_c0_g5_i1.p1  ORF type:complete len:250 (-),score=58.73 TRINITY_DN3488_c0_g5_i1:61-783(-)
MCIRDSSLISRRSKAQELSAVPYLNYLEAQPRIYDSYEEFMCDKLQDYKDELKAFSRKIKEAQRNLISNYQYPLVGRYKQKNHSRSLNRHKANHNTISDTRTNESPVSTRSKVVLIKNGRNQKVIGIGSNRRSLAKGKSSFTTTNERPTFNARSKGSRLLMTGVDDSGNSAKPNTSIGIRKIGEKKGSVLLMSMAKRRQELAEAERRAHKLFLKSKLSNILRNIDSTRNVFMERSVLDYK